MSGISQVVNAFDINLLNIGDNFILQYDGHEYHVEVVGSIRERNTDIVPSGTILNIKDYQVMVLNFNEITDQYECSKLYANDFIPFMIDKNLIDDIYFSTPKKTFNIKQVEEIA